MKSKLALLIFMSLIFAGCGDPLTSFGVFEAYVGRNLIDSTNYALSSPSNWSLVQIDGTRVVFNNAGINGAITTDAVRLEALNQLADGDFSQGTLAGGTGIAWDFGGTGSSMTGNIVGDSLVFQRTASNDYAFLNVAPTDRLTSLGVGEVSTFRTKATFTFTTANNINEGFLSFFLLGDPPTASYTDTDLINRAKKDFPVGSPQTYELNLIVNDTDLDHLVIISESGVTVNLDSIEMLEIPTIGEKAYSIAIDVPYLPVSGENLPLLAGGNFTFTIYIQEDSVLPTANKFSVSNLGLELAAYRKGETLEYATTSAFVSVTPPTGSWQQVSIEIKNPLETEALEEFSSSDSEKALQIRLYPFAPSSPEAGTIFLSDPSLSWSPF